jgi:hypothetical protein
LLARAGGRIFVHADANTTRSGQRIIRPDVSLC